MRKPATYRSTAANRRAFISEYSKKTLCGKEELEAILRISDDLDVEPEYVMQRGSFDKSCNHLDMVRAVSGTALAVDLTPRDIAEVVSPRTAMTLHGAARLRYSKEIPHPPSKKLEAEFRASPGASVSPSAIMSAVVGKHYGHEAPGEAESRKWQAVCVKAYGKKDGDAFFAAVLYLFAYAASMRPGMTYRTARVVIDAVSSGATIDNAINLAAGLLGDTHAIRPEFVFGMHSKAGLRALPKAPYGVAIPRLAILRLMYAYGSPYAERALSEATRSNPDESVVAAGKAAAARARRENAIARMTLITKGKCSKEDADAILAISKRLDVEPEEFIGELDALPCNFFGIRQITTEILEEAKNSGYSPSDAVSKRAAISWSANKSIKYEERLNERLAEENAIKYIEGATNEPKASAEVIMSEFYGAFPYHVYARAKRVLSRHFRGGSVGMAIVAFGVACEKTYSIRDAHAILDALAVGRASKESSKLSVDRMAKAIASAVRAPSYTALSFRCSNLAESIRVELLSTFNSLGAKWAKGELARVKNLADCARRNPAITPAVAQRVGSNIGVRFGKGITPAALARGMREELEHRDVTRGKYSTTAKIAVAHLKEDPRYYAKLAKCMKR